MANLQSLQRLQLQSERRGIGRGLADLLEDTGRERKYTKSDFRINRKDLRQTRQRGLQDIGREKSRGLRDVGFQRQDVKLEAERGREDFSTRLTNMISDFQTLGHQQEQTAAAAGITGGSYGAAAAAARAANLARAREPIDTGMERLEQDTSTALSRLGTQAGDIRSDARLGGRRLRQDVRHDMRGARIDRRRTLADIVTRRQRGTRESAIGRIEINKQLATLRR